MAIWRGVIYNDFSRFRKTNFHAKQKREEILLVKDPVCAMEVDEKRARDTG